MATQKSLTSMTKMPICGNWLCLTWTYFLQCVRICFETVPTSNLNIFGQAELAHYFELQSSVLPICWQPIIVSSTATARCALSFLYYIFYLLINCTTSDDYYFYNHSSIYPILITYFWHERHIEVDKISTRKDRIDNEDSRVMPMLVIPRIDNLIKCQNEISGYPPFSE